MNIIILGSRDLSVKILNFFLNHEKVNVIGVLSPNFKTWWDDDLQNVALRNSITILDSIDQCYDFPVDYLFSINYWKILQPEFVKHFQNRIFNIHHSYRMKYRGRFSTSWAILNARKLDCWYHGSSIHIVNTELDGGDIVASRKCCILPTDTAENLFERVEKLSFEMFKTWFDKDFLNGTLHFIDPDPDWYIYEKGSIDAQRIDQELSSLEVYDRIRAWTFKERKGSYFEVDGNKVYVSIRN